MTTEECFSNADIEAPRGGKKKPAPESLAEMVEQLNELSKQEKELQEIEKRFRQTADASLIAEYLPTERPLRKVSLVEDLGDKPRAIWNPSGLTDAEIQQHHEDVKRMFPNIAVREVTTTEGERMFAYVGADVQTVRGAMRLLREEQAIGREIAEREAALRKAVDGKAPERGEREAGSPPETPVLPKAKEPAVSR